MKLKKYQDFIKESSLFNQYQELKEILYSFNNHGPYDIRKENWYVYDQSKNKVGSHYMFIDNNKTLVIDKLNFKEAVDEKKGTIDHATKFLEQVIKFCAENKMIPAVSPDRIIDRKTRKKVKDFYLKNGFVSNSGKNTKSSISETMYKPM